MQDGRLYMLQTRNGKRTGPAALRIALEMEREVRGGLRLQLGSHVAGRRAGWPHLVLPVRRLPSGRAMQQTDQHCLLFRSPCAFLMPQGLCTADQAVLMVEPRHLDQLLHPMFENEKVGVRTAAVMIVSGSTENNAAKGSSHRASIDFVLHPVHDNLMHP